MVHGELGSMDMKVEMGGYGWIDIKMNTDMDILVIVDKRIN